MLVFKTVTGTYGEFPQIENDPFLYASKIRHINPLSLPSVLFGETISWGV